jgi:ubiquinone biosynthesis protein
MAQQRTRNLGRISEIAQVAVRHGFGYFFESHKLTDLLPWHERPLDDSGEPVSQRGAHLREMLDELGPTFVKFGQLLSMRPDVLPPDIIVELRGLQDDVRPFPFEDVERVVREDLDLSIEQLFSEFDESPIAAASIGQVHRALLPNGRQVAVKVQRPEAPRQIEADLALLYQAARIARERVRALDFVDARELVDEFSRSIRQELDYRLEARNAERIHRNFAGHPHVRVPRVYWSYTRARVLTLEYLEGIQLADLPNEAFSLDERARLATLLTEAWMTMIFRHGFFHADPHPANILVFGPEQFGLVDFGLTGALTDEDVSRATRLFIDAANENVDLLPKRLADLGVRVPKENEERFQAELREIYYRYYGATLREIDPLQVIREIELYPDFNVFEVARPFARRLLAARYTPDRVVSRARRESYNLARIALEAPYQVHDILQELRDGQIEVGFVHKGLDQFMRSMSVAFNRLVVALVVTGGLIGSSLIGIFAQGGPQIFGIHFLSVVGFGLSIVLGAWLLLAVMRSGRL